MQNWNRSGTRAAMAAAVVGIVSLTQTANATSVLFQDEATFVDHLDTSFFNDFSNASGPGPSYSAAGAGFAYTIDSGNDGLWMAGDVGVNEALNSLRIEFTGDPVYAVGGNIYSTATWGGLIQSTLTVTLSDGTMETFMHVDTTQHFVGFVASEALEWMEIIAHNGNVSPFHYATVDDLYVGTAGSVSAIPTPTAACAGLAMMGALGFRRLRPCDRAAGIA